MARARLDPVKVACGRRLALARKAQGYPSRRAFAKLTLAAGGDETDVKRAADNLEHWERGQALVPPWYIDRLRGMFGITHDYIYADDLTSMPEGPKIKIIRQRDETDTD